MKKVILLLSLHDPNTEVRQTQKRVEQVVTRMYWLPSICQKFYLVGRDKKKQHWQVLKIDRSEPSDLSMLEDPTIYTEAEIKLLLARVAEGNKSSGGLNLVTQAYGIVGMSLDLDTVDPQKSRRISCREF